jgi:hypothetical protein
MARCKVCDHPERSAIELVMSTATVRDVARQFGLSKDTVQRHRTLHLALALKAARASRERESTAIARVAVEREIVSAETILDQLADLQARTLAALDRAESDEDSRPTDIARIVREVRENALATARLCGLLKDGHGATIDNRVQIQINEFKPYSTDELRAVVRRELPPAGADQ